VKLLGTLHRQRKIKSILICLCTIIQNGSGTYCAYKFISDTHTVGFSGNIFMKRKTYCLRISRLNNDLGNVSKTRTSSEMYVRSLVRA